MFASFFAVAPVVRATASPATATARRSLAALPLPFMCTLPSRGAWGFGDCSTECGDVSPRFGKYLRGILCHPILDPLASCARAGAHDCVADLGRAVAVLERRSVRSNLGVACDRGQHVVQLVD